MSQTSLQGLKLGSKTKKSGEEIVAFGGKIINFFFLAGVAGRDQAELKEALDI